MKRNISVRVFDGGGRPASGARVVCYVYQTLASGGFPEKYTDSDGEVEFDIDIDEYAEISLSVNGYEKYKRGPVRGSFRFEI